MNDRLTALGLAMMGGAAAQMSDPCSWMGSQYLNRPITQRQIQKYIERGDPWDIPQQDNLLLLLIK